MNKYVTHTFRLISRSARAQFLVVISLLMPLMLLLLRSKFQESPIEVMPFAFTIIFLCIVNAFTFFYGLFTFSWESQYYTLLATQPINHQKYIGGKYLVHILSVVVWCLLSVSLTIIAGFPQEIPMILVALSIYCCGLNIPIVLFFSTYNREKIDLNTAIVIYDKFYPAHIAILFTAVVFPTIMFVGICQTWGLMIGLMIFSLLGGLGILFSRFFIKKIANLYNSNHYNYYQSFSK